MCIRDRSYPSGNSSPVTHTEQAPGFFSRAFSITLPSPLPAKFVTTNAAYADQWTNLPAMVWHPILKVPTNGPISGQYQHTIHCGVQERSNVWAEEMCIRDRVLSDPQRRGLLHGRRQLVATWLLGQFCRQHVGNL